MRSEGGLLLTHTESESYMISPHHPCGAPPPQAGEDKVFSVRLMISAGMTKPLAVIARLVRAIQINAGLDYRNKSGNDTPGVIV